MSASVYRNATPDNEDGEHDKDVAVHGVPPVLHMVPLLHRHLARVPDQRFYKYQAMIAITDTEILNFNMGKLTVFALAVMEYAVGVSKFGKNPMTL